MLLAVSGLRLSCAVPLWRNQRVVEFFDLAQSCCVVSNNRYLWHNQNNFIMKKKSFATPLIALLIKWSGIGITDGRNKIGGTVLSKSRQGATARNKVSPINRRTSAQSFIRAGFAAFSQQFRTLGASVINAWNAYAATGVSITNIFGDSVRMSGINLFIRLNQNLRLAQQTAITNPPVTVEPPDVIELIQPNGVVSTTTLVSKVTFQGATTTVPANQTLMVYATPKLSKGVRFVKSQLRFFKAQAAGTDTGTSNLWDDYTALYGAPAEGDNIVFAVQLMANLSGVTGTPQQIAAPIEA